MVKVPVPAWASLWMSFDHINGLRRVTCIRKHLRNLAHGNGLPGSRYRLPRGRYAGSGCMVGETQTQRQGVQMGLKVFNLTERVGIDFDWWIELHLDTCWVGGYLISEQTKTYKRIVMTCG